MLTSIRSCKNVLRTVSHTKATSKCTGLTKTRETKCQTLAAKYGARSLHTTSSLLKKRAILDPIKPPEPELALDGEIVPQSRLNDILSHLGEDDSAPILQKTEMELEPFAVNEVLDVGRHTKILPGTLLSKPINSFCLFFKILFRFSPLGPLFLQTMSDQYLEFEGDLCICHI